MNFFEHQQQARRRTTRAVLLFALAVLAIVAATNLAVLAVFYMLGTLQLDGLVPFTTWLMQQPRLVLWTSAITVGLIGAASLYRMASLSGGGGSVARSLGATLIDHDTRDPLRRQLLNVVEETAIASGVPAPEVYVLEQEGGINAFAAGFSTSDAAIAVTRGALESLTRDELQGVIAHEFSHILNGDMRLNMRLVGVSFGILVVALAGRMILRGLAHTRSSSGSGRGGGQALLAGMLLGLTLVVVGYIGVLFARLIKSAVSRHREYLADASAVQFTRNPQGIAGALKKIAATPLRATLANTESEEIGHMLIAERRGLFDSLFASHPPIVERIRILEPSFDPAELAHIRLAPMRPAPVAAPPPPLSHVEKLAILPLMVVATIGRPGPSQRTIAARARADLPPGLRAAAHSPQDALGVVLALVLSRDDRVRERQQARIRERVRMTADADARLTALGAQARQLPPALRLPLLEITFPILRQRPPEQLRELTTLVEELVRMDAHVTVLDYTFARLLRMQLLEALAPQANARARPARKLFDLQHDLQILFAVMAGAGHDTEPAARAAFDAGMRRLLPAAPPEFVPAPAEWMTPLDRALNRLDRMIPPVKQVLIESLVITVSHDQQLTLGETELLRVVCASLHCPLPPLVAAGS